MIAIESFSLTAATITLAAMAHEPPQAIDDEVGTAADRVVAGDVLSNDGGWAGGLRVVAVDGGAVGAPFLTPAGARLRVDADGAFLYDPIDAFAALPLGEVAVERIGYAVRDDRGGEATAALVVSVTGANAPPIVVGSLPDQRYTLGAPISPVDASVVFSDPGDQLRFSAEGLPAGLAIDALTGVIDGAPTETADGRIARVAALDIAGQSAAAAFQITVEAARPVLTAAFETQAYTVGVAMTPLRLADRFAPTPAPTRFVIAPGSDALPAGLTLSPDGVLSGEPGEYVDEPRIVLVRAIAADGGSTDAVVPIRVAEIDNILPPGRPTLTVENAVTQTLSNGDHRLTIASGKTYAIASYDLRLATGETYELTAQVLRRTVSGNIRARVAGFRSNNFPQTPFSADVLAAAPADLVATSTFTALANATSGEEPDRHLVAVAIAGAAGEHADIRSLRLRPVSAGAVEAAIATLFPPVYESPVVGDVRDVVRQRGEQTTVDLTGYAMNVSRLSVDPSSDPLPPGLSLSGRTLIGAPLEHGEHDIVLRAWNDAEEYELLRFLVKIADVSPAFATAAPLWRTGQDVAYPLAPLFAFAPERVELLADSAALVDGLNFDAETMTISGAPLSVSALASGERLRLRADAGNRSQEAELRVWVGAPVISSAVTGLAVQSGGATLSDVTPSSAVAAHNGNGALRLRRTWSAQVGATLTMRVRVWRNRTGVARGLVSRIGSGDVIQHNWNTASGTIGLDHAIISRSFVAGGVTGEVSIELSSMEAGDVFVIGEFEVLDAARQEVHATGRAFPHSVSPEVPMAVDLRAMFVNATSYAATEAGRGALPAGMTVDAENGQLIVDGAAEGDYDIVAAGVSAANAVQQSFPLTVRRGLFSYPGANFGPRSVDQGRYRGVISQISRIGPDRWRVARRSGDVAMALHRLWGLTRGGRYRIAIETEQGSLPATAVIQAWASVHTDRLGFIDKFSGATLLGSWSAGAGGLAEVEFVAPDNHPWIMIEAEAEGARHFHLGRITVTPLPGDEHAAAPRVDQGGARLFGLEHGRRYRLTSPGATRLALLRGDDETDRAAGPVLDFHAASEILAVVTDGGAPTLQETGPTPHHLAPPPTPEPGARFPFLHVWPGSITPDVVVDPAGAGDFTTLQAALDATPASGGIVILCRGAVGDVQLTGRRFAETVTVIADGQYGARTGRVLLDDVRRLTLRGLHVAGGVRLARTQDVTIMQNLFTGGYDGSRQSLDTGGGEHFNLRVLSNDFIGRPQSGVDAKDGKTKNFIGNPVTNAISLFNVHHSQIAGNRLRGFRVDGMKLGAVRVAVDHNLIYDAFPGSGDHADAVQLQQPFQRYNSWHSYRMNVIADDIPVATGSAKMHGLWSGNQLAGLVGMRVEQNAIHSKNDVWGIGHGDAILDYRILDNTLWGRGGLAGGGQRWIGWSEGIASGNVTRVNGAIVRRVDNASWSEIGAGAIWQNPDSIYGLAYRSDAPAHLVGKGATALVARLNAEPDAPAAPLDETWRLERVDPATARIVLIAPVMGRDSAVTRYEISVDGAAPVAVALNPPATMTAEFPAPTGANIRLRAATPTATGQYGTTKSSP